MSQKPLIPSPAGIPASFLDRSEPQTPLSSHQPADSSLNFSPASALLPKTIYVDCTATVNNGLNTGIQRVVRNLIQVSTELKNRLHIEIKPVLVIGSEFRVLSLENYGEVGILSKKYFTEEKIRIFYLKVKGLLFVLFRKSKNKYLINSSDTLFHLLDKLKGLFQKYFISKRLKKFKGAIQKVHFTSQDILILADSWWAFGVADCATKLKKKTGIKIVTLIYDFIPITFPEFRDALSAYGFEEKLEVVRKVSDAYIGISKFVASEIRRLIPEAPAVDYFYLGGDFVPRKINYTPSVRTWPLEIEQGGFFLVVSTIEPRKGHSFILNAFDLFWKKNKLEKLCFVGRAGTHMDELITRIFNHPLKNKNLFTFYDVNDFELEVLYKKAKCLIFASKIEGFGLPLVEAMERGKPILASDIPVFREICDDYAEYFSLEDPHDLEKKLLAFNQSSQAKTNISKKWINWGESLEQFYTKVLGMLS